MFFFFSSRRRHTRFDCDWSSDVCSSDLRLVLAAASGKQDLEIASIYDVNRHTAALWRQRVRAAGIGSLWEIQPGRGRKPKYDQEKRDALIAATLETKPKGDRKSTRLNSSHSQISYAVFCL